jgi:small subunit ribosomal protein S27Ae
MAKKQRKNRHVVKHGEFYKDGKVQKQFCPKCGTGFVLAEHGNRTHCGKCGYTEFKK